MKDKAYNLIQLAEVLFFNGSPSTGLDNPNIRNPVAKPLEDILYIVTATDDGGCRNADSVFIRVNPKTDIFIPSAFTPNDDGKNDILKPSLSIQFKLNYFTIYDRWGQIVYTTSQSGTGWDGKLNGLLQNNDVYIWMIKVTDRSNKVIEKKGIVALIR
jgi:gliding motility-associated-like protein